MQRSALLAVIVLFASSPTPADEIRTPTGWIGLGYSFHTGGEADKPAWLHVQQVAPNGPAYLAGIRSQDVITAIDGRPLPFANKTQALAFFAKLKPGRTLKLLVVRRDRKFSIRVKAIHLPAEYQRRWDENMQHLKRSKRE